MTARRSARRLSEQLDFLARVLIALVVRFGAVLTRGGQVLGDDS
jgi:hypothetical protein